MEFVSTFFKSSLPKYLQSLPIPKTFGGFAALTSAQIVKLVIFYAVLAVLIFAVIKLVTSLLPKKPAHVNKKIKKTNPKVVDVCEIEDLAEKLTYCRCWKSEKFPFCDGTHNKHNEETGDNVGPLVIKAKEK